MLARAERDVISLEVRGSAELNETVIDLFDRRDDVGIEPV